MPQENSGIFDILGPVMIGPSSSHTAGVARLALKMRKMFNAPIASADITLYGSLAATGRGHSSDQAVIAGLLGIESDDERLGRAGNILAEEVTAGRGFSAHIQFVAEIEAHWHPNTLVIELAGTGGEKMKIRGSSVGGGAIRIDEFDGYRIALSGELPALLIEHRDTVGVIAKVSSILAIAGYNIASINSSRKEKGAMAMMMVETDGEISASVMEELLALKNIIRVVPC
jgi:L-serine dehydratase